MIWKIDPSAIQDAVFFMRPGTYKTDETMNIQCQYITEMSSSIDTAKNENKCNYRAETQYIVHSIILKTRVNLNVVADRNKPSIS